jgi:hypothetical protein
MLTNWLPGGENKLPPNASHQVCSLQGFRQLLWSALPEGAGRPGKRSNPMLSQVYHDFVQTLDLGGARREFQNTRESEGHSLFGFSWLHACADRDAWRELVG